MDWKIFLTALSTIFLAELGDKTQLAVITLAASTRKPVAVGLGAGVALLSLTALGVVAGQAAANWLPEQLIRRGAAVLFVFVGVWMWFRP